MQSHDPQYTYLYRLLAATEAPFVTTSSETVRVACPVEGFSFGQWISQQMSTVNTNVLACNTLHAQRVNERVFVQNIHSQFDSTSRLECLYGMFY